MMIIIMLVYGFVILTLDLGKFHFLFRAASLCISRWEWGKGADLRALALHYPIFPVFSTYPPYFLLMFSKHRRYLMFRKRFDYLRNILFSFYEQSVQKNFKTSRSSCVFLLFHMDINPFADSFTSALQDIGRKAGMTSIHQIDCGCFLISKCVDYKVSTI